MGECHGKFRKIRAGNADERRRGRPSYLIHYPDGTIRPALTERERVLLRSLAAGKSEREIATEIGLAVKSVQNLESVLEAKWGVNLVRIVLEALRSGDIRGALEPDEDAPAADEE